MKMTALCGGTPPLGALPRLSPAECMIAPSIRHERSSSALIASQHVRILSELLLRCPHTVSTVPRHCQVCFARGVHVSHLTIQECPKVARIGVYGTKIGKQYPGDTRRWFERFGTLTKRSGQLSGSAQTHWNAGGARYSRAKLTFLPVVSRKRAVCLTAACCARVPSLALPAGRMPTIAVHQR